MTAAILFFAIFCVSVRAENPTAYEVYSKLLEESLDSSVRYSEGMMKGWFFVRTGIYHDLLKLMSPSGDTLDEFIQSLTPEKRAVFLQAFFSREKKPWAEFLVQEKEKGDVPLNSISQETAQKIFYGEFPGLEGKGLSSTFDKQWNFVPDEKLKAEQFIEKFSSHDVNGFRWMLVFREQKSYGDFEEVLRWSRKILGLPDIDYNTEMHMIVDGGLSLKKDKIMSRLSNIVGYQGNYGNILSMRLYDQAVMARVYSEDLSDIGGILALDRVKPSSLPETGVLASRLGISMEIAEKALFHIEQAMNFYEIKSFLVPLSSWRDISLLGEAKVRALESLTRTFLRETARIKGSEESRMFQMRRLHRRWVNASLFTEDMEFKLMPKPEGAVGKILTFQTPSAVENVVDVNKVNLGIEYTGRFPIDHKMSFGKSSSVSWNRERKKLMQKLARELSSELRGSGEAHKKTGGHGHNLGYTYTFLDGEGRKWSVDWDGIQRRYDGVGKIKKGSVGGGNLEVITAKFVPKVWEIEAVYRVFKKFGIRPSHTHAGGGHINVDLAPFEGRPRAMARFLALFHQYQNLIEFMFQGSVTNFPVRERLARELREFRGSELELKELLYNERYFYSLPKDKTRYAPVNIVPYFQEVIPAEFLAEDIDQNNPTVEWRPRFRFVAPEEKRIELRFFHAPRNAFESALHIRFVRAMLHGAFNEDFPIGPFAGRGVYHYLQDVQKTFGELDALCKTLQLECRLYRPLLAEHLNRLDTWQQSFSESLEQIGKSKSQKMTVFNQALENDHVWGQAISCEQQAQRLLGGGP